MPAKKTPSAFDFEKALKDLETIVKTIEQGGLSLEESLKLFEQGVGLTRQCQQALKEAEQKVKILSGENLKDFSSAKALDQDEEECDPDDKE